MCYWHTMNAHTTIVPAGETEDYVPVRYRLRVADYLLLHDKGSFRDEETELVDGQIFYMSPEWRPHYRIKSELMHRLHEAVRKAGLPFFVGSDGSIALSDNDMPRPDISLTSAAEGDGAIPAASVPLAVEVSSTTLGMDLGPKATRYAAGGLAEYWVIDLSGRTINRFASPSAEGYARHDEIPFGGPITSVTMPELTISSADL